jgi:hypothetical protein
MMGLCVDGRLLLKMVVPQVAGQAIRTQIGPDAVASKMPQIARANQAFILYGHLFPFNFARFSPFLRQPIQNIAFIP